MKKTVIFLCMLISLYAESQIIYRGFSSEVEVITKLNEPFITAIERHIKVAKVNKLKNKDAFFILIAVFPGIPEMSIPRKIHDSIYRTNDFLTEMPFDSLTPDYSLSIALGNKTYMHNGWRYFGESYSTYYYNYKGYDILISSRLNLIFEGENKFISMALKLIRDEDIQLQSPYDVSTHYTFWNKYIQEVRYKTLIAPPWTDGPDDFE